MKYVDLDKLNDLKVKGVISEDEFIREREKLLDEDENNQETLYWGMGEKNFCMALHLSQLASFIVPLLGIVLPIVMWSIYKEKNEMINRNGKYAINWLISSIIYIVISAVLIFVIIGIPMLILLLLLNIIFCIMAGVKASSGKAWRYPMSIQFIK